MGYLTALEKAGAKVIRYIYTGDYSGNIIAEVEYQGESGYIVINYGSCSYCDSYQAFEEDFGWDQPVTEEELAEFGRRYLDIRTKESLIEEYTEQATWDIDAEDVLQWLNQATP
jgi:hypothetical protein